MTDRQDAIDLWLPGVMEMFPMLDPEVEAAVDRMTKLVKHLDRTTERTVGRFGLNAGEFRVLLHLRQAPDQRQSAGELVRRLRISSGAMTNRLDGLERQGFIDRERDPADRRSVLVTLTTPGADVLSRAVDAQAEEEKQMLAALSPADQRRLNGLLRRLVLSIDDERERT
jgi:DNA-binding MarR family transcriptional regulator